MTQRHAIRTLVTVVFLVATLGASSSLLAGGRSGPLKARLGVRDRIRLFKKARTTEAIVRGGHTPPVDLHIARASVRAGITWRKVGGGYPDAQVFELDGVDRAGGELHLVMSAPASGHVMQKKYGGRPFSVVQDYAANDTIYLTHTGPGATTSESVLKIPSRGLVTREGFTVDIREKGPHTFWYFRGGPNDRSGGEGSEPGLRKVTFIVK
jgi:hypothetical protein